ncbi:outer membrane protein [Methylopila sp. M107]|uniref:outer membrane protein n=1 Tax=Methylopila sp. M107 TaxID=1101190 RepID=UPI00035FB09D|nr:outer membrane protein [Methylopila sp. M107]
MIRSLLLGAASAVALVSAASAADLPIEPAPVAVEVPSFSWTGPYLGVQAGYGWGKSKIAGFKGLDPKGALVGGYAGYNFEYNGLLLGVETDFNWSDQDDKINGRVGRLPASVKNEVNWAGATRGRVGFAVGRFVAYGAGGVAYADRKLSVRVGAAGASASKTAVGWTVGGGVETAIADSVVARAEYRYTDYGTDKFKGVKSDLDEHRVLAGVAYKFW